MASWWRHVAADADEERRFPSLGDALAMAGELAAPANTWREVRRIERDGRTWYLKIFRRTQLKNRLRFARTAPRCRRDAERELGVANALTRSGIRCARPVAIGVDGPASYYLCAELPGDTMRDKIAAGRCDARLYRAATRLVAAIARAGVWLPDLAAEHVFVIAAGGDEPELAVIDLHNGRLGHTPRRREVVRLLRRLQRSVRGLPIPRRRMLWFALRVLAALDRRSEARALLARLPPLDTHARYDACGKSAAYRARNPQRTRRELDCLRAVWPGRSGDLIVDVPCGAGRLAQLLRRELRCRVVGADRSRAMLAEHRAAWSDSSLVLADAARLPFADRCAEGVVVFRFLHHLSPADARRVLHEAARVARRYVIVSFLHPLAPHALQRRLRRLWSRRARTRFNHSPRQVRRWLAEAGLRPLAWSAERRYLREFWVASFVRDAAAQARPAIRDRRS